MIPQVAYKGHGDGHLAGSCGSYQTSKRYHVACPTLRHLNADVTLTPT